MKRLSASCKSWSNLPADIVDLIAENIYYYADYADQIRFRAVCKSWHATSFPLKYRTIKPWIFSCKTDNSSLSHLYDTTFKQKYTIKTDTRVLGATIHASICGWLLFSKTRTTYSSPSSLFFYNPFTAEVIELPELPLISSDKATFSSSPTSSDCTVFIVSILYSSEKICISTCKPGQKQWTRHWYDEYYGDLHGLVYSFKGFLYCSFSNNVLGAFKATTKDWKTFSHNSIRPNSIYIHGGLIESHDGNLLTLYYSSAEFQWHIFRFDWLRRKWFDVENLEKRAMFVGRTSMSVAAVEEESELANTIHLAGYDWCTSFLFKRSESQKLFCPQSYGWIMDEFMNVWIQPPISRGNRRISNLLSVTPL